MAVDSSQVLDSAGDTWASSITSILFWTGENGDVGRERNGSTLDHGFPAINLLDIKPLRSSIPDMARRSLQRVDKDPPPTHLLASPDAERQRLNEMPRFVIRPDHERRHFILSGIQLIPLPHGLTQSRT